MAAQLREERRLSRPAKLGGELSLALAGLAGALGATGLLNAALTVAGMACSLLLAALCARDVWRGKATLRATLAQEERRVARARAAQDSLLRRGQEEDTARLRDWQARDRAFRAQRHWYGVALPAEIDRVDVAGGTLAGWSALTTMLAGLRLAAGGAVTVLDFSAGAVAQDLLTVARGSGIDPLVWVLPGDLPRFDLGAGLPGAALADVLAVAASAGRDPATPAGLAQDTAILERLAAVLGVAADAGQPGIAQLAAGLRVLAQVGDPGEDVRCGLISEAQAEAITGLYGRAAADGVITERALALEAQLRKLACLGSAPLLLPPSRLRVVALDRTAAVADAPVLISYVTAALTHLLRGEPRRDARSAPWRHTVLVSGAEQLRGELLDRLCDACETTGVGLVLAYRYMPAHVRERLGRGNAATAFMRLGNADDAKVASEQIGTEHRFVVAQLTDSVGASVTDTAGQAYTSTVGTASSVSLSASRSVSTGRGGGRGLNWSGFSAFGSATMSAHAETSYSEGISESASRTEGINLGTSWGTQTAQAAGATSSLARTSQRSREFLVEAHELQQLPVSAVIVSYPSAAGRRVVLADANPGIGSLPTSTLRGLQEVGPAEGAGRGGARSAASVPPPVARRPGFTQPSAQQTSPRPPSPAQRSLHQPSPHQPSPQQPSREAGPERRGGRSGRRLAGPVSPPSRDPAQAPLSWREEG